MEKPENRSCVQFYYFHHLLRDSTSVAMFLFYLPFIFLLIGSNDRKI